MLRSVYVVWYFVEIHELQTELGVFEGGVPLILGHGVLLLVLVMVVVVVVVVGVAVVVANQSFSITAEPHISVSEWLNVKVR